LSGFCRGAESPVLPFTLLLNTAVQLHPDTNGREVLQVKLSTNQIALRPRGSPCSVYRSNGALPRDPAHSAEGFRRIRVIGLLSH